MQRFIHDYFGFSQVENKGFWAVIGAVLVLPFTALLSYIGLDPAWQSPLDNPQKADSLMALIEVKHQAERPNYGEYENHFSPSHEDDFSSAKAVKLFPFDPNVISADQWQELGLPKFLAERIVKYRNAGGKFKKKEDLQRIYGLRPETYERLAAYVQISGTPEASLPAEIAPNKADEAITKSPVAETKTPKITQFDLNKADTTQLVKVRGIGAKLALRIIKFRDNLGGFYTENQLREVFGLDSAVVDETLKYAFVRSPSLRKIKINEVTPEEFRHPYLKPYVAKSIMAYRQQHGNFKSASDLANVKLLDAKTLEKITPYLEF
ncbi:MAG: helix-hairpin-helix domain-containing protein [Spirosomataceae bacterium]